MRLFSLHKLRLRLTDYGTLLPYAILGGIVGVLYAPITMSFELVIALSTRLWVLPLTAALWSVALIDIIFRRLPAAETQHSLTDVIGRMHTEHGHLPIPNTIVEYFAGQGVSGGPAMLVMATPASIENHYRTHF